MMKSPFEKCWETSGEASQKITSIEKLLLRTSPEFQKLHHRMRLKNRLTKGIKFQYVYKENDNSKAFVMIFDNEKSLLLNKPVFMKYGKYLTRYGLRLSNIKIEEKVSIFKALYELDFDYKIAEDPKEIAAIYEKSSTTARSCMGYHRRHFGYCKGHHPTEVYGGDSCIKLAYVQGFGGCTIARSLIIPSRKLFIRCYPVDAPIGNALQSKLMRDGYKRALCLGDVEGVKINKIHLHNNYYLMPYFDMGSVAIDMGDHFEISNNASIKDHIGLTSTVGYNYL